MATVPEYAPPLRWLLAVWLAACGSQHGAQRPGEPAAAFAVETRLLVFGDFGDATARQRAITAAMAREHGRAPFDLAIQLGDNLYPCGPDPLRPGAERCEFAADGNTVPDFDADDPAFAVNEAPLAALRTPGGSALPSFLALGNHDVGLEPRCRLVELPDDSARRRRACLNVARRSQAWHMPGRHYGVDVGRVRVIVVDTNVAVSEYGGFTLDAEIAFVREGARGCEDRVCFLAGHHPPAWAQGRGRPLEPREVRERLERLLSAAGGAVRVIAGHRHAAQHLVSGGQDVFIVGSTARFGDPDDEALHGSDAVLRFASAAAAFGVVEAGAFGWRFRFVGADGRPMYCCEAIGGERCQPVRCRG